MENGYGYFRIKALPKAEYKHFKLLVKEFQLADDSELLRVMLHVMHAVGQLTDTHGVNIGVGIIHNAVNTLRQNGGTQ